MRGFAKHVTDNFAGSINTFQQMANSPNTNASAEGMYKTLITGLLDQVLSIVPNADDRARFCVSHFSN